MGETPLAELSDEAWLRRAREHVAKTGSWDVDMDGEGPPVKPSELRSPVPARCPRCRDEPELHVFVRREITSGTPLLYCSRCNGFWAQGGALSIGLLPEDRGHPALTAKALPPPCRSCGAVIGPAGLCAGCGGTPGPLPCPVCRKEMTRMTQGSAALDECKECRGVWFDASEMIRVYGFALNDPRAKKK